MLSWNQNDEFVDFFEIPKANGKLTPELIFYIQRSTIK